MDSGKARLHWPLWSSTLVDVRAQDSEFVGRGWKRKWKLQYYDGVYTGVSRVRDSLV